MTRRAPRHSGRTVSRRGVTLIEFVLAIGITGMIASATAAMLVGVARSTEFERGRRESIIRAQALGVRVSGYVTPSLYLLDVGPNSLVTWLSDTRSSGTVHATETRWISVDGGGTLTVQFVSFPESMTQTERDLYDLEYPAASDWWVVLKTYQELGFTDSIRLADGIADLKFQRGQGPELAKKLVTTTVTFAEDKGAQTFVTSASIREWQEPTL